MCTFVSFISVAGASMEFVQVLKTTSALPEQQIFLWLKKSKIQSDCFQQGCKPGRWSRCWAKTKRKNMISWILPSGASRCYRRTQIFKYLQTDDWWKNTASSQNLKILGDFLLGLSHSRDFLKTWPLTSRSVSLRLFVDAPVVSINYRAHKVGSSRLPPRAFQAEG